MVPQKPTASARATSAVMPGPGMTAAMVSATVKAIRVVGSMGALATVGR